MSAPAFSSGLRYSDLERVVEQLGVADAQVHRDHLISSLLAGLAASPVAKSVTFIGGTALTRTWLPSLRLSEDIDLLLTSPANAREGRSAVTGALEEVFERSVVRSHGRLVWSPRLSETGGSAPAILATDSGLQVRVQLLGPVGYPNWPTMTYDIEQRYVDVRPARLSVLTPAGFVAAKMAAWLDRREARDLYDLWALAEAGFVDATAAEVYRRVGPSGVLPRTFGIPPTADEWQAKLGHQCRLEIGPADAHLAVEAAWRSL